jgi:hypothetical protein
MQRITQRSGSAQGMRASHSNFPALRYTEQPNFLSIRAGEKTVGKLFSGRSNVAIAQIRLEVRVGAL